MTLDLDDAIRAVLNDLVAAAPDIDEDLAPPPLPRSQSSPHAPTRPMTIAAAAIIVVGVAGIAVVRSLSGDTASTDNRQETVASPANVVPTSDPAATVPAASDPPADDLETASTTPPASPPETWPTSVPFDWVEPPSWLTFQLAPAPVHVDLGVLDGQHVTIERTADSLCIQHTDGSGCTITDDGRPLDTTQYASSGGSTGRVGEPPQFFRYWMVPTDVVPTLVDEAGRVLCEPHPTEIPTLGDATLWTCHSDVDLFASTARIVYHHGTETYQAP